MDHPAALRVYLLHGPQGLYDNWRRVDTSDHTPPVIADLLDLDFKKLARGGWFSAISATYEGGWAAFREHQTLRNYVIGRIYENSVVGITVDSVKGNTITQGLMGDYREESGDVVASLRLDVECFYNRFARHGGTASGVWCQRISNQNDKIRILRNEAWTPTTTRSDNLVEGGFALAETTSRLVLTLNYEIPEHRSRNSLRVYDPLVVGSPKCSILIGGEWGSPSVAPDGQYAYAWNVNHETGIATLYEVDTRVPDCGVRTVIMNTGQPTRWPMPPVVTEDKVIVIQTKTPQLGDLVAYDRVSLSMAWRVDAGIPWHENNLSGWQRASDFYFQCDRENCFYAGRSAVRVVQHNTGFTLPWIWFSSDARDEAFLNPQLYCTRDGRDCGFIIQNTLSVFSCVECEESLCSDGKPIGSTDYGPRCCAGPTRRCPEVSCEKCEQMIGWCPNSEGRRCLVYPSTRLYRFSTNDE